MMNLNSVNNFDKETIDVLKNCDICEHSDTLFVDRIKYACVYLKNEAYIVDDQDEVYNIINNQTYRVDFLCRKHVTKFAYSYYAVHDTVNYHMLALTRDGRVFGWGENAFQQITNTRGEQIFDPVRLDFAYGYFTMWKSWCAGKLLEISETVMLNTCSSFWKGMGGTLTNRVNFKMISCGQAHCMAVTKDNSIVVWGNNKYGQIGNRKTGDIEFPHRILVNKEHIEDFPTAAKGGAKCALLCSSTIAALLITLIALIQKVISLALLLVATSCVKIRAAPSFFQEDRDLEANPGEKSRPNLIRSISCGAFHNLVLFENGDVWGWGDNKFGQLARVTAILHTEPRPLFSRAIAISAVNNHSLILCRKQHGTFLYTMGDNTYGQLGQFEVIQCRVPLRIERNFNFQDIATVNGISLGVTADGSVYAWGLYRFEEIKGRHTNILTNSKKAFIIEEPKRVNCRSINEFITRYSSQTKETIKIRSLNPGQSQGDLCGGILIEESELTVVEYYQQVMDKDGRVRDVDINEVRESATKVIHVSTENKYVLFDNCNVTSNRDLNVTDIQQTGWLGGMFSKKKK